MKTNRSIKNKVCVLSPIILLSVFLPAMAASFTQGKYANAGLKDAEVQLFFKTLQGAIDKRDKPAVAAMINYPIVVIINGRRQSIKTEAAMIKNYDVVFDRQLSEFLLQTKIEDLWSRDQGVATPRGEIWFSGVIKDLQHTDKYEIKITAINGMNR